MFAFPVTRSYRSKDEGKTWQPINAGFKRLEIKAILVTGDGVYAGTSDGVYRLNQAGNRWAIVTTGLTDILVHALVRSADGTLYAGTSGKGVLRFKQNATGWDRVQHGLKDHEGMIENYIRVLALDQEQGLLAGTFDGGVFRSADGGTTWRSISRALPNDSIRGIVILEESWVVATGTGIFKTLDKLPGAGPWGWISRNLSWYRWPRPRPCSIPPVCSGSWWRREAARSCPGCRSRFAAPSPSVTRVKRM